MIYATIIESGEEYASSFETWDQLHAATFSPENEYPITIETPARISGKTYRERKANAEQILVDMQYILMTPGLFWSEYDDITSDAERIARRHGLLTEARENGVC